MTKKNVLLLLVGLAIVVATIGFGVVWQKSGMLTSSGPSGASSQDVAKKQARGTTDPLKVLVASSTLNVGDRIEDGDLTWRSWPRSADLGSETVTYDPKKPNGTTKADLKSKVTGAIIKEPVSREQPVPESAWFRRDQAGFLPGVLHNGMRAVTINVNKRTANSGFILPGDHIDVLVSRPAQVTGEDDNNDYRAKTVVEPVVKAVRVLAVNQTLNGNGKAMDKKARTLTLEVTPTQAQKVHAAEQLGQFGVALRPIGQNGETPNHKQRRSVRPFVTDRIIFNDYASALTGDDPEPSTPKRDGGSRQDRESMNPSEASDGPIIIYRNGNKDQAITENGESG